MMKGALGLCLLALLASSAALRSTPAGVGGKRSSGAKRSAVHVGGGLASTKLPRFQSKGLLGLASGSKAKVKGKAKFIGSMLGGLASMMMGMPSMYGGGHGGRVMGTMYNNMVPQAQAVLNSDQVMGSMGMGMPLRAAEMAEGGDNPAIGAAAAAAAAQPRMSMGGAGAPAGLIPNTMGR